MTSHSFVAHAQTVPLRDIFMKSIVAKADLPAGLVLEERHLAAKKPAGGLPAERMPDLLGRRLKRAVPVDSLLSLEDLEA